MEPPQLCAADPEDQAWWHTPLIPALGRQRQAEPCEIEASLIYIASSRIAGDQSQKKKKSHLSSPRTASLDPGFLRTGCTLPSPQIQRPSFLSNFYLFIYFPFQLPTQISRHQTPARCVPAAGFSHTPYSLPASSSRIPPG